MTTKHIINSLKLGKKVPNMLRYVIVLVPLLSLAVRGSCPVHLGPGGVHESDHHSYDERKVSLSQNQEPSSDMSDIDSYYYDFKIVEDFKIQMYKHKILNNLGMNIEPEKMKKMDDRKLRIELARIEEEKQNRKTQLASQRNKRSMTCDQIQDNNSVCCLERLYVNFTEIGWDKWILHPDGYYANYCRGECDLSHARYYHTALLSKVNHSIDICCSPNKTAPLTLLYYDEDNNVKRKVLPAMIAESCDCA